AVGGGARGRDCVVPGEAEARWRGGEVARWLGGGDWGGVGGCARTGCPTGSGSSSGGSNGDRATWPPGRLATCRTHHHLRNARPPIHRRARGPARCAYRAELPGERQDG